MIRLLFFILPFCCFGQVGFFSSGVEKTPTYQGFNGSAIVNYGTLYWTSDSISKIDLNSAFSIEVWQFLPHDVASKEFIRVSSQDTLSNYFYLGIDGNSYFEIGFVKGGSSLTIDSENEQGASPKTTSGKIDVKDWYHIVYTFDGSTGHTLYVNGLEATFNNSSGSFQNIYGDYVFKHYNLYRASVFRVFGSELTSTNVNTLWNEGEPLLTTSIPNIDLEYTHQGNSWDGTKWIIYDSSDSPVDGESVGFGQYNLVPITDFEANQSFDISIPVGQFTVIDNYLGFSEFNFENSGSKIGPYASSFIGPYVWYDTLNEITLIGVLDRVGLGANMEGSLYVYNHSSNILKRRQKNGNNVSSANGVIDTHPGMAVITNGDSGVTLQERKHGSPIYYNPISSGTLGNISSFGSQEAYPCIQNLGSDIYAIVRESIGGSNANDIRYTKSTNGGSTWSGYTKIAELTSPDALYPSSFYHPTKIAFFCSRRSGGTGGSFTEAFFIQSDDGTNWYNADSTFSTSSTITDSELSTYYQVDTTNAGENASIVIAALGNDTIVVNAGDSVLIAGDKENFIGKPYPSGLSNPQAFIYVSPGVWDIVAIQNNNLNIYRTSDSFDSVSIRQTINGEWDIDRVKVTQNNSQTNEVLIACVIDAKNVTELPGNNLYLGFYIYDKTQ